MEAAYLLQLKTPASTDTAELGRALSDFLDDVPLSGDLARLIAPDTDESPFDGFTVVDGSGLRIELDPQTLRALPPPNDGETCYEVRLVLREGHDPEKASRVLSHLVDGHTESLGVVQWPESVGHIPTHQVLQLDRWTVPAYQPPAVEVDPTRLSLTSASAEALSPIMERLAKPGELDDSYLVCVDPDDLTAVLAVVTIALANVAEPTPLQALRDSDDWLALLLALLVSVERYLQDIPVLGVKGRADGRAELLAILPQTIDRAEQLVAPGADPDKFPEALKLALLAVLASQFPDLLDPNNMEG